jgi:hypothetical protein
VIEDAVLIATGAPVSPSAPVSPGARAEPVRAEIIAAHDSELEAASAEVDLTVTSRELTLRPGGTGELEIVVANRAASAIRGEVQLISPAGSWDCLPKWTTGFSAEAGTSAALRFPVTVAADARPRQRWWVIAKVMYFGRTRYGEPVEVIVT